MPTIDQLPPAYTVSDSDEIALWQSGNTVAATRAQILSGVQPQITLASGMLVGRTSAGSGGPEAISVGANLTLSNGSLIAATPFSIATLGNGSPPQDNDVVPLLQSGQEAAVTYAGFMSSLSRLSGIDLSMQMVGPIGGVGLRSLAAVTSDVLSIESFGAAGDGVTDDSVAFLAALESGSVLHLGAKTYVVNACLTAVGQCAILGIPGLSIIKRTSVNQTGPWINVEANQCLISGVTFDAGGPASGDYAAVCVTSSCEHVIVKQSSFINAPGTSNGHGLIISTNLGASCAVTDCRFTGNSLSGLFFSGLGSCYICHCDAESNGQAGFNAVSGEAVTITLSTACGNQCGISIGSQGNAQSSSISQFLLTQNRCSGNSAWGISILYVAAEVSGNMLAQNGAVAFGGGVFLRGSGCVISENTIDCDATCIDIRGCAQIKIASNSIRSANTCILAGGSQLTSISRNTLLSGAFGVLISAIEPSISNQLTNIVSVDGNLITLTGRNAVGISVLDNAQGISVRDNTFSTTGFASPNQALWLHSTSVLVRGNNWNEIVPVNSNITTFISQPTLILPDFADDLLVTGGGSIVQLVLTAHQADTYGQVSLIQVTAPGSGYTTASISISGSGSGASAAAVIDNGQILWIIVTNPGSGYGSIGTSLTVNISGDGIGALATGLVGAPTLSGRRFHLTSTTPITFLVSGSTQGLRTWTQSNLVLPAFGSAEIEGVLGNYAITASPPTGYLTPTNLGNLLIQTMTDGDVIVKPDGTGFFQLASDTDPAGISFQIGHGTPEDVVIANPGSDYRNLDGGVGSTLWVKQTGTGSQGWVAIA